MLALLAASSGPLGVNAVESWVGTATESLGSALVAQIVGRVPSENVLVSPLSIQACFSLVYPGAADMTAKEIQDTMRYPAALSAADIQQGFRDAQWLKFDGSTENEHKPAMPLLSIAYRVYLHSGSSPILALAPTYASLVGDLIEPVDMSSPTAGARINEWVDAQTHGRITRVVDDKLPEMTKLVAINTVYLKAQWAMPFMKEQTRSAPFLESMGDGAAALGSEVNYMTQERKFLYHATDTHSIVYLPLHGGLEMAVAIPIKCDGAYVPVDSMLGSEGRSLAQWTLLALALPKFEFNADYVPLNTDLQAMGINQAFCDGNGGCGPAADFSVMIDDSSEVKALHVNFVIHKTYIGVDEVGIEAAAATAIGMAGITSVPDDPPEPIPFFANRAFDFAIYEVNSSVVLFRGRVRQPTTHESGAATGGPASDLNTDDPFSALAAGICTVAAGAAGMSSSRNFAVAVWAAVMAARAGI